VVCEFVGLQALSCVSIQAKIWHLSEDGVVESMSNPVSVVVQNGKRMENIAWNPIANNVLAVSTQLAITVYDVAGQSEWIGECFDHMLNNCTTF